MELKDKLKLIIKTSGLSYAKFSELTSIPLSTLKKYATGERDTSFGVFQKIIKTFPQYTLWLALDQVAPESGQISPEENPPKMNMVGVPEKLLNDAFGQTMTTAIALSWLTPKEGIEFSMLSDLHRHNFVEAGGILFSQDSEQEENESKAG